MSDSATTNRILVRDPNSGAISKIIQTRLLRLDVTVDGLPSRTQFQDVHPSMSTEDVLLQITSQLVVSTLTKKVTTHVLADTDERLHVLATVETRE